MRRFYKAVDTAPAEGGFAVRLDGRTPRSPAGERLILPTQALADLAAADWAAQGQNIVPDTMPAVRLAWTALALAEPEARQAAIDRVADFAGADLVCYFADGPADLVERQERHWGPVIEWAGTALGARFRRTQGIVHQPQPDASLARIRELAAAEDAYALAGLSAATALFSSAILAFALRQGELTADAAFALSRLDETFQEEKWGVDSDAAFRADAMAAEAVLLERWFAALGYRH
jgi:chaperone required for assembly of F1-ATPase